MPPPLTFVPQSPPGVPNSQTKDAGQPGNTVATAKGDRWVGTIAVPAISAAAFGTITLNNKFITSGTSVIFCQARLVGTDTNTGRGPVIYVTGIANGTCSIVVKTFTSGAISVNVWVIDYFIVN